MVEGQEHCCCLSRFYRVYFPYLQKLEFVAGKCFWAGNSVEKRRNHLKHMYSYRYEGIICAYIRWWFRWWNRSKYFLHQHSSKIPPEWYTTIRIIYLHTKGISSSEIPIFHLGVIGQRRPTYWKKRWRHRWHWPYRGTQLTSTDFSFTVNTNTVWLLSSMTIAPFSVANTMKIANPFVLKRRVSEQASWLTSLFPMMMANCVCVSGQTQVKTCKPIKCNVKSVHLHLSVNVSSCVCKFDYFPEFSF